MSYVSSMLITCAVTEDEADGGLPALHDWCRAHATQRGIRPSFFRPLGLEPAENGKAMQIHVLACAANYFDEDALIEAFPTFPWLFPDQALLTIHAEHDSWAIVCGDGKTWKHDLYDWSKGERYDVRP
jgi:hypothetical protein